MCMEEREFKRIVYCGYTYTERSTNRDRKEEKHAELLPSVG